MTNVSSIMQKEQKKHFKMAVRVYCSFKIIEYHFTSCRLLIDILAFQMDVFIVSGVTSSLINHVNVAR